MFAQAIMLNKLILFLKSNEGITLVDNAKDFNNEFERITLRNNAINSDNEIRFGVIIFLFLHTNQLISRY